MHLLIRCVWSDALSRLPVRTDGLSLSTRMFFSVSNDGETYRYTSHTFTFVG